MEIPAERWYKAIGVRRSRRQYTNAPVESIIVKKIEDVCNQFTPFSSARSVFINHSANRVFKSIFGSYGKVKGATSFIAFIGDMNDPYIQEKVGYTGEAIMLEMTALGLATCWIGGFFRPEVTAKLIGLKSSEKILAVTPVGYAVKTLTWEERVMSGYGRAYQRKSLCEIVTNYNVIKDDSWTKLALDAARIAPSAINRQPWRFTVEFNRITISVNKPGIEFNRFDYGISKRLDCGIAMLHVEVAALFQNITGQWKFLQSPDVATFIVVPGE